MFLNIFYINSFNDSTDCKNLRCHGSFSPKTILIFLSFSAITKHSIIHLDCYRSKSYTSVMIPKSNFLRKERISISLFSLYTVLQNQNNKSSNFWVFHTSGGILSRPAAFLFLIFLSTLLSFSRVNCPSMMSSWLLAIFVISFQGDSSNVISTSVFVLLAGSF